MPATVSVLVPVAVDAAYSYAAETPLAPGTLVEVPLGPRRVLGAVWDDPPDGGVAASRLRPVARVFEAPPLDAAMRAFVEWIARWTLAPRGMVLRMVLRSPDALVPEAARAGVVLAGPPPPRATAARARVLDVAATGPAWSKAGLAAAAGVSPSVIDGLVAAGTLAPVELPPPPPAPRPDPFAAHPVLSDEQAGAAAALVAAVAASAFSVTLLDGVTGSGKTEVFLEAVAEALARGRQALVMMPEITLTQTVLERFERRFAARPAEWHSAVPTAVRARVWRGVTTGEVRVVVGARSALLLPFRELGLIVVDEEHDPAYKQEDGVHYHARDMAVVRGRIGRFPVVLSSATPSIESRVNAEAGRYARIVLKSRVPGAELPEVAAVDLRVTPPERGRWLAPPLVAAMGETLGAGGQALLFLNRRGYAPLTLCGACGHRFQCPNCTAWLVDHRLRGTLACHHCGHVEPRPAACPSCGAADRLVACGPGVERIAEEARDRFPEARLLVLSSDIGGGTERLRRELQAIADGEVDLIVGTQLVAKGHTFPGLKLVGVVDADLGLQSGDPRAAERTFQLLAQVTGRAGRTGARGLGLLQTHAPDHPVIQALASGDAEAFYRTEMEERRRAGLPPFGRMAAIIVSGPDRPAAEAHARAIARAAPSVAGIRVLGPAEAALAVVRGRHRFRLLVRAPRAVDLQGYLRDWLERAPPPRGGVRQQVDVDPQSFL
jgi:primosomal protein N' (replication factor Y)